LSPAAYFSARKSLLFMVGGLIAFSLYLYFFVGVDQLVSALDRINTEYYLLFYTVAIGAVVLALLFWTAAWRTLLQELSVELRMKEAFLFFWVGYFVDLVVPSQTIGGELTRLYLVRNETNGDLGAIAASAVTNRIVEYVIVTVGLFISVVVMLVAGNLPGIISDFLILVLSGSVIYLAILLYLALSERAATVLVSIWYKLKKLVRLKKSSAVDMSENARASLAVFYDGFKSFRRSPKRLIEPLFFQFLSFVFNLGAYYLVFASLGFQSLPFEFYILMYFIGTAVQASTASFSVGSLDIILATAFILYGIPAGDSGIAVVVLRSATYWIPLLVSFVMVQVVGVRNVLGQQSEEMKQLETLEDTPPITKTRFAQQYSKKNRIQKKIGITPHARLQMRRALGNTNK
jgi:uncharacterized protein (TIRG00374 family)